jgi:hypothetical protein
MAVIGRDRVGALARQQLACRDRTKAFPSLRSGLYLEQKLPQPPGGAALGDDVAGVVVD